ncbi:uncharacterized protein LOC144245911 [Lonchura striata]
MARQKLAPLQKGPCNHVCVSQSKALLKRGVISEALPDAAARSPIPREELSAERKTDAPGPSLFSPSSRPGAAALHGQPGCRAFWRADLPENTEGGFGSGSGEPEERLIEKRFIPRSASAARPPEADSGRNQGFGDESWFNGNTQASGRAKTGKEHPQFLARLFHRVEEKIQAISVRACKSRVAFVCPCAPRTETAELVGESGRPFSSLTAQHGSECRGEERMPRLNNALSIVSINTL